MIRVQSNLLNAAHMTNLDEVIYNTPHNRRAFDSDNKKIHRILDKLTLGTDATNSIKTHCLTYDGSRS